MTGNIYRVKYDSEMILNQEKENIKKCKDFIYKLDYDKERKKIYACGDRGMIMSF